MRTVSAAMPAATAAIPAAAAAMAPGCSLAVRLARVTTLVAAAFPAAAARLARLAPWLAVTFAARFTLRALLAVFLAARPADLASFRVDRLADFRADFLVAAIASLRGVGDVRLVTGK